MRRRLERLAPPIIVVALTPPRPTLQVVDWGRFRRSLNILEVVAIITLLRSVALDRWVTVVMAGLLLLGASVAQRGKSWGVALALAAGAWFPVAFLLGIAPSWFMAIGALAAVPFVHAAKAFVKLDRAATWVLASTAISLGTIGAFAWKQAAWSVFEAVPMLRPGLFPQHGLLLAVAAAVSIVAVRMGRASSEDGAALRVSANGPSPRIGLRVPVEHDLEDDANDAELSQNEVEASLSSSASGAVEPEKRLRLSTKH